MIYIITIQIQVPVEVSKHRVPKICNVGRQHHIMQCSEGGELNQLDEEKGI